MDNKRLVFNKVTGKVVATTDINNKAEVTRFEKLGHMVASEWNYKKWMFTITGKHKWL